MIRKLQLPVVNNCRLLESVAWMFSSLLKKEDFYLLVHFTELHKIALSISPHISWDSEIGQCLFMDVKAGCRNARKDKFSSLIFLFFFTNEPLPLYSDMLTLQEQYWVFVTCDFYFLIMFCNLVFGNTSASQFKEICWC